MKILGVMPKMDDFEIDTLHNWIFSYGLESLYQIPNSLKKSAIITLVKKYNLV
jgi:hypothetical protein